MLKSIIYPILYSLISKKTLLFRLMIACLCVPYTISQIDLLILWVLDLEILNKPQDIQIDSLLLDKETLILIKATNPLAIMDLLTTVDFPLLLLLNTPLTTTMKELLHRLMDITHINIKNIMDIATLSLLNKDLSHITLV